MLCRKEIVDRLEVEPRLFVGLQHARETHRRVGGDSTVTVDDLIEPHERDTGGFGKAHLRNAARLEKVFEKDLARMRRRDASRNWEGHCATFVC